MGFVVEEFPFGSLIVFDRTELIITFGKGFGAGADEKVFGVGLPNAQGAGPDYFSNSAGFGAAGFEGCSLIGCWSLIFSF